VIYSLAGSIRPIEYSNNVIRNRTRDLQACSTVPHLPDLCWCNSKYGHQSASLWSWGHTSCWRMRINMPCTNILSKSYACMSTPWSLDNVYTSKSYKGGDRVADVLKLGTCQLKEKTLTEKHRSCRVAGSWRMVDNPSQKNDLSRKARVHTRLSIQLLLLLLLTN
jgi:hypothetical protein